MAIIFINYYIKLFIWCTETLLKLTSSDRKMWKSKKNQGKNPTNQVQLLTEIKDLDNNNLRTYTDKDESVFGGELRLRYKPLSSPSLVCWKLILGKPV